MSEFMGMASKGMGQCLNCQRYRGGRTCEAFPKGIPEFVWDDMVPHTRQLEGDDGLLFMPWGDMLADAKAQLEKEQQAGKEGK